MKKNKIKKLFRKLIVLKNKIEEELKFKKK